MELAGGSVVWVWGLGYGTPVVVSYVYTPKFFAQAVPGELFRLQM